MIESQDYGCVKTEENPGGARTTHSHFNNRLNVPRPSVYRKKKKPDPVLTFCPVVTTVLALKCMTCAQNRAAYMSKRLSGVRTFKPHVETSQSETHKLRWELCSSS